MPSKIKPNTPIFGRTPKNRCKPCWPTHENGSLITAADAKGALKWYQRAVEGLEVAVEQGEHWYEKALAGARAGAKRCRQEVAS
jgi:hypothetical protein